MSELHHQSHDSAGNQYGELIPSAKKPEPDTRITAMTSDGFEVEAPEGTEFEIHQVSAEPKTPCPTCGELETFKIVLGRKAGQPYCIDPYHTNPQTPNEVELKEVDAFMAGLGFSLYPGHETTKLTSTRWYRPNTAALTSGKTTHLHVTTDIGLFWYEQFKAWHHRESAKEREALEWIISLDDIDGPGLEARRTVTLTKIIERAKAAIKAQDPANQGDQNNGR